VPNRDNFLHCGVTKRGYFPILDSLRFLASLGVFLSHSVVFLKIPGGDLSFGKFMLDAGYYGVVFFFVLSGFLISWLLLQEKRATGGIALKKFYIRRALRIWPLYYGIILLSFFVFPNLVHGHPVGGIGNWKMPLLLYVCFLPNIVPHTGYYLATCFHTYTVGYEEQFYLFWPMVLRNAGRRLGYGLAVLFFVPVLLDLLYYWLLGHGHVLPRPVDGFVQEALGFIPAFVAGGIAAFLFLQGRERILRIIGWKGTRYLTITVILALMYFVPPFWIGYTNLVAAIFALLILNLVLSNVSGGKIGAILAKGGKVSYGIYIYHAAILIFVSLAMNRVRFAVAGQPLVTYLIYLLLSFGLLLLTAAASYRYFERRFLRMKDRWR
jgi:peptidoglycan/LPS O-acetylase OafA/YrhL